MLRATGTVKNEAQKETRALGRSIAPRLQTAVPSISLMLLAFLSVASGLIPDKVTRGRRELMLLAYLAQLAPPKEPRQA
jgi:hypothetical protein